jgi:8-oxo-dGTP pyrophosphatase MutT (NUDIX family)
VAGTVEEDESYDDNIYKETMEEIGITDLPLQASKKLFFDHGRQYFCQFYIGIIDKSAETFIVDEREVASVKWISFDDLQKDVVTHPEKYLSTMSTCLEAIT